MKSFYQVLIFAATLPSCLPGIAAAADRVSVTGQVQGPSPFIEEVSLALSEPQLLTSVQFTVVPNAGSVTRPISATYSAAYLVARGYWDGSSGNMTVPVFGLYAGAANTVVLDFAFSDGSRVQRGVAFTTTAYTDSCNALNNGRVVVQARRKTSDISFDYVLLKKYCSADTPTILDTDGNVRWVGTAGIATQASLLFQNGFYLSNGSGVTRIEFDGTYRTLADYSNIGVTFTGHHNFDPGRTGIVLDVNTTTQTESTDVEIDGAGNVLNVWDLGAIISKAMVAGGDDPSLFVQPVGTDWFHNNATTYNPADNTLIVSSRENFVIALDYDTQAIRWIFGDATKHWHQFKSLRAFELQRGLRTLAPEGQHAVSIATNGDLSLFDDGQQSFYQTPPGRVQTYSAARSYHIDTGARTATETYAYAQHQSVYSDICSSVYEDTTAPGNRLVDYAVAQGRTLTEIVGLDPKGRKVFDYQYPAEAVCGTAWNAQILHLENLQF